MPPEIQPQLIFFSGLGADSRLFVLQKLEFESLQTPEWLAPQAAESMDEFVDRWSLALKLGENTIVGGASFGGLVAQRLAQRIGARHCLLFGSIKSSSEIPKRIRILRPIHKLAFVWVIRFWQFVVLLLTKIFGRLLSRRLNSVLRQFSASNPHLIKWSIRRFFDFFDESLVPDHPISKLTLHQIHGTRERLFPFALLDHSPVAAFESVRIYPIENAGHLLTLTHSKQVNEIIRQILEPENTSG